MKKEEKSEKIIGGFAIVSVIFFLCVMNAIENVEITRQADKKIFALAQDFLGIGHYLLPIFWGIIFYWFNSSQEISLNLRWMVLSLLFLGSIFLFFL